MPLRIITNLGSGSDPSTLLGPRFFGDDIDGDDYVIFNIDSGHMLVSQVLQKRSLESLVAFARKLVPDQLGEIQKIRGKPKDAAAYLVKFLFDNVALDQVIAAMEQLEKAALELIEDRLRSVPSRGSRYKIGGMVIDVPDTAGGQRELALPNFERSPADDVQLPLGSTFANIAISPFGFYPITAETVALLAPGGYFVVLGNGSNKYSKNPAGEARPETFGLAECDLPGCLGALTRASSVHTHGGDVRGLTSKCFRLQ